MLYDAVPPCWVNSIMRGFQSVIVRNFMPWTCFALIHAVEC